MRRITILLITFTLLIGNIVKADEGMWFLAFINKNYEQMKAMGFKLTPEDIYSINNASLKDAVVALDHGSCTGEIVSSQGLLLTNHHCGYGEIQAHSTVEHDYLQDGFWAATMEDELPNPGKTVSFLIRMEDVSAQVLSTVNDKMSEKMRADVIEKTINKIVDNAIAGTNYEAEVLEMYEGNAYYLFIYETFRDIRLVGAPPSSIGKYGGDTDNWYWPRHTGDFSIFRVYCAPDGSPADYSPDNVPYTPKKFLKVSLKGIYEGDFAMIMGYPGTTNRYLTSWEVEEVMNHENAIRYEVRTVKQDIMKKYMDKDPEIKIQYAAKYAQSANYWKYSEGQNLGLKNLNVIKRKQKFEKALMKWVKKNPERKEKYGEMLDIIETTVTNRKDADIATNYWLETIYLGSEIELFFLQNFTMYQTLMGDDQAEIDSVVEATKKESETFFKDYNAALDKELFIAMFKIYVEKVHPDFKPSIYEIVESEYEGNIEKYADDIYKNSIFTDKERYFEFMENPDADVFSKDLGFEYAYSMLQDYWSILHKLEKYEKEYSKGRRLFVDAFMKMYAENDPNHLYYPDANSSMRITYGKVGGYTYNNTKYNYYTTVDEYMAKEDANNEEFFITEKMKKLYQNKDWGKYAYPDGVLRVNFITNNDITGGNSGSPVLNGNGELIGLAFDGNWEGMSGDIAFEPDYQKTICVDIKYVLWVIDKYGEAQRLINEMELVE